MNSWKARPERGDRPVLKIKKLSEDAITPTRGTDGSAGLDLYATEDQTIFPGDIVAVHPRIAMEIPPGYYGLLVTRSSMGKRGIRIAAGANIIDSDYRGEVIAYMANDGVYPCKLQRGDRFAQIVITPYIPCVVQEVETLSETERKGGFGSTGK